MLFGAERDVFVVSVVLGKLLSRGNCREVEVKWGALNGLGEMGVGLLMVFARGFVGDGRGFSGIGVVVALVFGFVEEGGDLLEVGLAVVLSRAFAGCFEDFCCLVSSSLSGCVDDPSHDVLLSRLMVCVLISFAVFGESARFSFSSIAFSFASNIRKCVDLRKSQMSSTNPGKALSQKHNNV